MPPFFSIAVTTYDRVDLLRQTLESILAQTFTDFEILVGNDNQSRQVGRDFPDLSDPRILWIDHPKNLGYINNVNHLLELAQGRFFTSLGDDDVYFPQYLETMYRAVTEYGALKAAFCGFLHGQNPPPAVPPIEGSIRIYSGPEWLQGYLSKTFPAVGCYGVFLREFIRSLGGTHQLGSSSLPPYCDNLLAVQAGLGEKVAYCPAPLLFYRVHGGSLSYVSTVYDDFFSAQREFLTLAEDVFRHPTHRGRRRTYRALLLAWFIKDFFSVMRRGGSGTRSLSAIIRYCFFILENLRATSNKMNILASIKSNVFSLYPRLLAVETAMLKSLSLSKRSFQKIFSHKLD
jgi:glycosyltransferase involved in cell wall biosynthesis